MGGKRLSLLSAAFLIGLVVITNATGVPLSGPWFVSLRPNHTIGLSGFGYSVALSADGSEALVSGVADNHQAGAVWAYKRNGRTWSETGQKLTGCESTNPTSGFGVSVAISGAGTTAIVGCPGFDHRDGAAAVFARTTGRWHQVGLLLLPSGEVSSARLGLSVSLSYNGRVAVVGGPIDSGPKTAKFVDGRGAVWIYVRKSSGWDQDGPKLTGAGESAIGDFGGSVGLSADGKTLIVGGANANNGRGGVWFFTRRPTGWVPVGGKHAGPAPRSLFGYAVALAGDGQVALVGVPGFHNAQGEVRIFVHTQHGWTGISQSLRLPHVPGQPRFGLSLGVTYRGSRAFVGAPTAEHLMGTVSTYDRDATGWNLEATVDSPNVGSRVGFGGAIAVSREGGIALVGAVGGSGHVAPAGRAWIISNL